MYIQNQTGEDVSSLTYEDQTDKHKYNSLSGQITIHLNTSANGRYVNISMTNRNKPNYHLSLVLCEVEVFGGT